MRILYENLEALGRRYPELKVQLASLSAGPKPVGRPKNLHERADAVRARLIVFLGVGDGSGIRAALDLDSVKTVLVVEPSFVLFRAALAHTDLQEALVSARVDWVVGHTGVALRSALSGLWATARYLFFSRSIAIVSVEERGRDLEEVRSEVRRAVEAGFSAAGSNPEDALVGLENVQQNLRAVAAFPSARALTDIYRGKPGFVVSTGPSLTQSLPMLRGANLANRFPIFCPDTSLPVLRQAGLKPHVVASRERKEVTIGHFEGAPEEDVGLLACPVLNPRIFQLHKGPVGLVYRSSDFMRWLKVDEEPFEFDGSAGNLAFRMAALAGCDPIILVGQDLCFGPNGDTHSPGAFHGHRQPQHEQLGIVEVPGREGGMVRSTPKWLYFLQCFELDVARVSARVINATARGARIQGTEVVSLRQVLAELPSGADPRPAMQEALEGPSRADRQARLSCLQKQIQSTRRALEVIRRYAAHGRGLAAKTKLTDFDFSQGDGTVPRLEQVLVHPRLAALDQVRNQMLAVDEETFDSFVMPVVQSTFLALEMERFGREFRASSSADLARACVDLYGEWFERMEELISRSQRLLGLGAAAVNKVGGRGVARRRSGARGRRRAC